MRFLASTAAIAQQAGDWRYDFARRGVQLTTTDCLIAATAHAHHATVVTGNAKDYPMFAPSQLITLDRGMAVA